MLYTARFRFRIRRTRIFRSQPDHAADTRHSYGEERYQLIGMIEKRLFVMVYTPRHDAIRIVSARKANQREVKHYENSTLDN